MLLLRCITGHDLESCFTHQCWGKTRVRYKFSWLAGNPIKPITDYSDCSFTVVNMKMYTMLTHFSNLELHLCLSPRTCFIQGNILWGLVLLCFFSTVLALYLIWQVLNWLRQVSYFCRWAVKQTELSDVKITLEKFEMPWWNKASKFYATSSFNFTQQPYTVTLGDVLFLVYVWAKHVNIVLCKLTGESYENTDRHMAIVAQRRWCVLQHSL